MKHLLNTSIMLAFTAGITGAGVTTTTDFSNGAEGWTGPSGIGGATNIEGTGGNDGEYMRTVFNDFGVTFRNNSNADFLGDYTTAEEITISIDVQVEYLNFFGQDVSRPWLVELRDFDTAQGGYPWTSAWFLFDNISQAANSDWMTYSTTFDPNSTDLPAGWGGYGAEDPNTFEPTLPDGVTFADVLSGVDEIAFTTLQPGFFFSFTDHTIGIDNISITHTVPTPSALALLGLSGLVGTRRRR
ncbi:MAG: PEP-CTERM sorting domain-containing protein [Phycisphaerales bacterium JB052]